MIRKQGHPPVLKIAFLFLFQTESQQSPFGLWLQDLGSGYVFCALEFASACFIIFGLFFCLMNCLPQND